MELRHLRYFVAVAEDMNFTRAATRLHIAHQALSVQIRKLEAEIGAELLSRQGREIKLTEAGRVFLEQARRTLAEAKRSVALARQAADGKIGRLSIGYISPAEFRIFPTIIPAFQKNWPDAHLSFQNLTSAHQLEALRRDELDLGFVWLPIPPDDFDVRELTQEALVVVLPASHRLASVEAVSISDLSQEPLIVFSRDVDANPFHEIEQLFQHAGAVMNVAHELGSWISMLNFIAMGRGCSVLYEYVRSIRLDGVVYKPLKAPNPVKTLCIIKRKGKGGLAESFFRFTVDRFCDSEFKERFVARRQRQPSSST